jgi:hypothetical protein
MASKIIPFIMLPFCLTAVVSLCGQNNHVSEYNVPDTVRECLHSLDDVYKVSGRINPFYLRGDFDGDGTADYAVLVVKGLQKGVVICRGDPPKAAVLGAGSPFQGTKDLDFDAWLVYRRMPVEQGVGEGPPPKLTGEAIEIAWEEKASGLIYWNGRRFAWYQQGD